jgi:hypothetical protein
VIGKVCQRGQRVSGLLHYLYASGPAQQEGRNRRNPHVDPRLVGGFDDPAELEPTVGTSGRRDFRRLVSLLDQPLAAAGVGRDKRPVYHLVISARKDPGTGALVDRHLSDGEWRDIAATYLDKMGLAPRGDDLGCRWVAVRHADDHVHVVATLARQDGRRVFPHNDYYRAGEASREVEAKYGLSPTAASDRTAAKRPTYAETQKTARRGQAEPVRDTLRRQVRTAAAGATTISEFLDRLRRDGVLVHERHSERNPGEITGYAVASADSLDAAGKPVYYGGGRLAADLTLPKLRARWEVAPAGEPADTSTESPAADAATGQRSARSAATAEDRSALTPAERVRIWEQATAAAARATAAIQAGAEVDPCGAGDAAWAASDFLAAAGRVVEGRRGGPLTTAAVDYDRAARELWGRVPPPSQAGQGLRAAAVAMTAARFVGRGEHQQLFALLAQLGALADAVTRLRENQDRAAQAAAARSAAEQLHRLAPVQPTPADGGRAREPVSALASARAAADALSEVSRRRGGPTPPAASAHRGRRR